MASLQQRRSFEIRTDWDGEAGVWWCWNDELPLSTEAPTFEQLVSRVLEIAPEIVAENGLAAPGDQIEVHVIAERVRRTASSKTRDCRKPLIGAAESCSTAGARMGCSADPLTKLAIGASSGELPLFIGKPPLLQPEVRRVPTPAACGDEVSPSDDTSGWSSGRR
jgi:hypothetical protein